MPADRGERGLRFHQRAGILSSFILLHLGRICWIARDLVHIYNEIFFFLLLL